MQFAWAWVFLFAGFLSSIQEYHAIHSGQALTPWGTTRLREVSPKSFWLLTSLGIAGATAALAIGALLFVV